MEWEPRNECLYYVLNNLLRSANRTKLKPWFSYLKLVLTALHKLPSERNVIWRGVNVDLHREYEVGKSYVWWAFSSCTLSLAVLESDEFLGRSGSRTLFSIESLNGRRISSHSYIALENEVLLLPATSFEVRGKLSLSRNVHIIHLKQVDTPFSLIELPTSTLRTEPMASLNEKHQVSTALSPNTLRVEPKLTLKTNYEIPIILPSVSASPHPTFALKKEKEQRAESYRNKKLEQVICQSSLNGPVTVENQELTDSDILFVIHRAIMDQNCSDLNISWNKITDVGAEHLGKALKSNRSLQRLDVLGNQISNRGARWISEALRVNITLTTLDIGHNQIGDEGARFLARALHVNSTLKDVCLYTNSVGDNGAQHLVEALASNTTLTLLNMGRNRITNQGINHFAVMLKRNSTLTHLYIGENPITNSGFSIIMNALCHNQKLKWLGIECSNITSECIKQIHNMFEINGILNGMCLPKTSFSSREQQQLQLMTKTKQNFQTWFLWYYY